ncbi:hypothetical protein CNMCM8694_000091 [Aspergillus lentulus]|nr:hypothetical protein CNMCM8060_006577 [Aspergillus lentulus]KAF4192691.1 hypothetical protein CNMCM8694_000091 [Aspergillus lentulus]
MRGLIFAITVWLVALRANAAAVFAHFMVSNSANFTVDTWKNDIKLAQEAHIDAFALNMAAGDPVNDKALPLAFEAARSLGFKLFFSFDYAGNGPWDKDVVIDLLLTYGADAAYYKYKNQPFASTFEGPTNARDWANIKADTGCFFVPDWSSLGAKAALEAGKGVVDGLFSWAAWPWGPQDMNTYVDASYLQYLEEAGGLPYMMPVSPWFFTNLPGYDKNWLWHGDHLWYDRWQEVLFIQPEFVEIISWNDYGESHHIGPLYEDTYELFTIGKAPFNFARDMPHDGWRALLPFIIDTYKKGNAAVDRETLVTWYRTVPGAACGEGGTSANTHSQLQIEFSPVQVMQDEVFFSALLTDEATVQVAIGDTVWSATWRNTPDGGVGIYHGSIPFFGATGDVEVSLWRAGNKILTLTGKPISSSCPHAIQNWNAWVGSVQSSGGPSRTPKLDLSHRECINGTGANNFEGLCGFSCRYGYCPIGACTCTRLGESRKKPNATGIQGYPLEGESASYGGLCSFDCNYGFCPDTACGTTSAPLSVPTVSEFLPPACIAGSGEGNLGGLCSYSCGFGFCPMGSCTCTARGPLVQPPAANTSITGAAAEGMDPVLYDDLCNFTCQRGYCPSGACVSHSSTKSGSGSGSGTGGGSGSGSGTGTDSGSGLIYLDGIVWESGHHTATCTPPCMFVFPPKPLRSTTVISFDPWTTVISCPFLTSTLLTLDTGSTTVLPYWEHPTTATVLSLPPVTLTAIPVWPVAIPTPAPTQVYVTSSVRPSPFDVTCTPTIGGETKVVGGTTTTLPGHSYTSGSITWSTGEVTITIGGSTTVSGEETVGPVTTTKITPHPYPTRTSEHPDPDLNDTPIDVSTDGAPGPKCPNCAPQSHTSSFCLPLCPLCPPGLGCPSSNSVSGGGSSGGSDDGEEDDEEEETGLQVTAPHMVALEELNGNAVSEDYTIDNAAFHDFWFPRSAPSSSLCSQPTSDPIPDSFVIYKYDKHQVHLDLSKDDTYAWYGYYFSYRNQVTAATVCDQLQMVLGPADAKLSDKYPISLGSFTLGGRTGCRYSAPDNHTPGSVVCDNAERGFTCLGYNYDSDNLNYGCGSTLSKDGTKTQIFYTKAVECLIY